jgi:DNA processing protein
MSEELKYKIAITLIPGIGDVLGKKLIAYCGSPEAVFRQRKSALMKIPGIGEFFANAVNKQQVFGQAEEEIRFMEEEAVRPLFYLDDDYPYRLKQCIDGPMLLYCKGIANLNAPKMMGVVGTRNATEYGKALCNELVDDLILQEVTIVSGLAYGIDICAHNRCVKQDAPTIGVLAHGLDMLYPSLHRQTAEKMIHCGALLTDYPSGTKPGRENFPRRNRIVAGMCDGLVVVESAVDGGSMITAEIANSYSREVFAYPGRTDDPCSAGCNQLIKNTKASLVENALDIRKMMGWEKQPAKRPLQQQLFVQLKPEEETIVAVMREKGNVHIDEISALAAIPVYRISAMLLDLEFSGVLRSLPGKMYRLN